METTLRFGDIECGAKAADFQHLAAKAYAQRLRPLCMCRRPRGVEMYLARVGGLLVAKRMPGSGSKHHIACHSFEAPATLSGLGDVLGGAIRTAPDDQGRIELRFEFTMSQRQQRGPAGEAPAGAGASAAEVTGNGSRLTLRGLLHYLWSEAGLHRWSPAMQGKRNWYVARKYLMQAAQNKVARAGNLSQLLFVPEPFILEDKEAIVRRRAAIFERTRAAKGKARRLMILAAEVKKIEEAPFGKRLLAWHLHDCPFLLRRDVGERLVRRFANELEIWSAFPNTHLMVCATFGLVDSGVPMIEACTLMLADPHWLPVESTPDKMLLEQLVSQQRRFEKCLRYNLPSEHVLASAVLTDTPNPVALHVLGADALLPAQAGAGQDDSGGIGLWVWRHSEEPMPTLPPSRA